MGFIGGLAFWLTQEKPPYDCGQVCADLASLSKSNPHCLRARCLEACNKRQLDGVCLRRTIHDIGGGDLGLESWRTCLASSDVGVDVLRRCTRSRDAQEKVNTVYDNVVFAFDKTRKDPGRACSLPKISICIPADSSCSQNVDEEPQEWNRLALHAMGSLKNDTDAFRYCLQADGEGKDARFTVSAYGDLDCDGIYSTYQRVGRFDEYARDDECVIDSPGIDRLDHENE